MSTDTTVPSYILKSVHSLPPLPAAVNRLLALTRDPEVAFSEIVRVIESDQTLTARTLRTANSSLYSVSRRVQTVQQAVVLLGENAITNMVLGVSVMSMQADMQGWPIDAGAFARHSIAVAVLARTLAERLCLPCPEEAFVAGLVHDIGKLALLNHSGDLYAGMLRAAQRGQRPLDQLERSIFKTDHSAVGAALCDHWNIPDSLSCIVAAHHAEAYPDADAVAAVVRDANNLVKVLQIGDGGNAYAELHSARQLPRHHVPPATLHELLLELPAQVREIEVAVAVGASSEETTAPAAPQGVFGERPAIYLQVPSSEQQELVALAALSMGYRPVPVEAGTSKAPDASAPLGGFIGDAAEASPQQAACRQRGVPVLDYPAWRSEHAQPEGDQMNLAKLRGWLAEGLLRPAGVL